MADTAIIGTQLSFDYASLPTDIASFAREQADEIRRHGKRAAESIVSIGQSLTEVKERLPHGSWLPWIKAEFGWSEDTARNFMRVHAVFGKSGTNPNLGPIDVGALYLLARPSTPEVVREAVLEVAAEGARVTHASTKAAVNWTRKQPPPADDWTPKTRQELKEVVREAAANIFRGPAERPRTATEAAVDAAWDQGRPTRELWSPVLELLTKLGELPPPVELFANFHERFAYSLRLAVPEADRWMIAFMELWRKRDGSR